MLRLADLAPFLFCDLKLKTMDGAAPACKILSVLEPHGLGTFHFVLNELAQKFGATIKSEAGGAVTAKKIAGLTEVP